MPPGEAVGQPLKHIETLQSWIVTPSSFTVPHIWCLVLIVKSQFWCSLVALCGPTQCRTYGHQLSCALPERPTTIPTPCHGCHWSWWPIIRWGALLPWWDPYHWPSLAKCPYHWSFSGLWPTCKHGDIEETNKRIMTIAQPKQNSWDLTWINWDFHMVRQPMHSGYDLAHGGWLMWETTLKSGLYHK